MNNENEPRDKWSYWPGPDIDWPEPSDEDEDEQRLESVRAWLHIEGTPDE